MCTVTFIPLNNSVFITHSRDEKSARSRALPPLVHEVNGYQILFPRDKKAGGTWIAINETGNTGVLLNGCFTKHIAVPPYRKSRGLIFLEIIASPDLLKAWKTIDLDNIEPFTLILWFNDRLFETCWNGSKKNIIELNPHERHIWASVTLYDPAAIGKRKGWFAEWNHDHAEPSMGDIISFHLTGGEGDINYDMRMNRDGHMLTVSLTSMQITPGSGTMKYLDLQGQTTYLEEINFLKDPVENQ